MKHPIKAGFLCALAAPFLPSCALQNAFHSQARALAPNQTYEVRKAVVAGTRFRPEMMSSYFFVVNTPSQSAVPTTSPVYATWIGEQLPNVRTTAYCHDEADHVAYGHLNAVGTFLKYGAVRSAAADWSRYPVGTRFRIASEPGVVYEVDDYGSALIGTGTIDLYRPTQGQMNDWGVRNVDIEVIQWGSLERSRALLRGRTHYPHVRHMFYDIESRINGHPAASTPMTPITAMAEPIQVTAPTLSPSI